MNKDRRKSLEQARSLIERAQMAIEEAKDLIADAASEERDYYDNMPESLQGGDKGSQADAAATALEELSQEIEALDFEDWFSRIDTATE